MSKPKLLLIAYRALGDFLYTAPVLPYLFEHFDVYLECSYKVHMLTHNDPRFKQIAVYAVENCSTDPKVREKEFAERWQKVRDQVKPDVEVNLNGTLEVTCIGERFQPEFHLPVGLRRAAFGPSGFYDAIFNRMGIPVPNPFNSEGLYFTEAEQAWGKFFLEKNKDNFVVVIPMAGSTIQKRFYGAVELARLVRAEMPESVVYLAGAEEDRALVPTDDPRIRQMCGKDISVKQAVLLTKYADMVVGPETFLLVAAGMWGTPKIILATTSSVYQMTQYQQNDFSIQAPIWCSPCHRAIYDHTDCESMLKDAAGKPLYPACTQRFDLGPIMERIRHVYQTWKALPKAVPASTTQSTQGDTASELIQSSAGASTKPAGT